MSEEELKILHGVSSDCVFDYFPSGSVDRERRVTYPIYKYDFGKYVLTGFHSRSIEEEPRVAHRKQSGYAYSIFGEKVLEGQQSIILCEGQSDCIILNQAGFKAVGLNGANSFKQECAESFLAHGIKKVYLLFDNDANGSGIRAARKTASLIVDEGMEAYIASLPSIRGHKSTDINSFYLFAPSIFRKTIRGAIGASVLYQQEKKPQKNYRTSIKKYDNVPIHTLWDFPYIAGREVTVNCMLDGHEDFNKSFRYNPEKNLFHCFGCGKGGGVVKFVMETQGLDFRKAIGLLEERMKTL